MPRKIRLPHWLATVATCGHDSSIFLMSYDESETTSGMQFVAILFISGLRLTIQKNIDFLNSKPTVGGGFFFKEKVGRQAIKNWT